MNVLVAILVSIIPVLVIIKLVYEMGEVKKQPWIIILVLFLSGILSWILVRFISNLLGTNIYKSQMEVATLLGDNGFFLISFGVISLIEEFFKFIIINIMCFKNKYFKNPYDAIMYAVCLSLGFAFIENIMYIINYGLSVAFSRALFSIPSHACFGIIMGYFLGMSKISKENNLYNDSIALRYSAFFFPFLFHGLYDFLLSLNNRIIYVIFIIFVFFMYGFSIYLIFRLYKLNSKKIKNRKENVLFVRVKPQNKKNIYYDILYNDNTNDLQVENKNNNSLETNWKKAELNETVYENDKVDMKMFRNDD